VIVPNAVQAKQTKRLTKMLSMKGVRVQTDKDVMNVKSRSSFESLFYGLVYYRIPRTQIPIGFILLFLVFIGISFSVWDFNPVNYWQAVGDIACVTALFVACSSARNSFMVGLLGIPFDRAITIHRWLGRWFLFLVLVHVILGWIYWAITPSQISIAYESSTAKFIYGYTAWSALIIMFFTSLEFVRRKWFNMFLWSHYLFIVYYVIGSLHDNEIYPYTITAAGVLILDYMTRAIWGTVIPTNTTEVRYKDGDILQIKFKKRLITRLMRMHKTGQYYFLNFPQIDVFEWHPFSVSSGPDEDIIEVHIKALGDHTTKLVNLAKSKNSLWVRTDGPYGNPKFNYRRFSTVVLCAGGIGMTPIMGIIKDVYRYGKIDSMSTKRHSSVLEKLFLVWVIKDSTQFKWFEEELKWCKLASQKKGMPEMEYMIYVTKGGSDLADGVHEGRPNWEEIFSKAAGKHPDHPPNSNKVVNVFTCGPRKLVNQCWDASVILDREGYPFQFHHECFEF